MAEGAISFLLSLLVPLIQDEFNLLSGVRQEIDFIRGEFEQMNAFLQVAESEDDNDPQLEVWVKQVRDTAYDAGDVLEQFMFRLNHRHGFFRKAYTFITTIIVRHKIASEIKRIKLKVDAISQGNQRYSQYPRNRQASSSNSLPTSIAYDSRGDALLLRENEIVGINKPKSELIKLLVDESTPRLQVVSVWGMGGLGKTTLVKKAFDDAQVVRHFEHHAWIIVSKWFQIKKLLKEMIQKLFSEVKKLVPVEVEGMEANELKQFISSFLQEKRYVIFLDDVWDPDAWNAIKYVFPDNQTHCRVILTTRDKSTASFASCESNGEVYNVLPLSEKDSRTLFCKKVFQGNPCPPNLEEMTNAILKKCEGLPLAIVTIGGLFATKDQRDIDEWRRIYRSLGDELVEQGKLKKLHKILNLSYINLPGYLKPCFLYLSIFPEDYIIHRWQLIRLWVAEEFAKPSLRLTAEEVAESYLSELLNRSLILLGGNDKENGYHIHDIWRELIVSRAIKQDFVSTLDTQQSNFPNKMRRLSIHNGLGNWQEIKHHATHVRSLILFGSTDSSFTSSIVGSLGDGARLLKVIELRNSPINTFPKQIRKLLHLTYLSLRGTDIEIIPKSIGDLQMLETLDLRQTKVTELPDEILKLCRLRHLLVYRCGLAGHSGFRVPKGIGKLTCLQKLCSIEIDRSDDNILEREIAKLTQLRKINILRLRSIDGKGLCSTLEKLRELRTLRIVAIDEEEMISLEPMSSPPEFLQNLYITARMEKLPQWIPFLQHLTQLYLRCNKLREDPLLQLQGLFNLTYLHLFNAYDGEALTVRAGGFKQLTMLVLDSFKGLEQMNVMENAMPRLEALYIKDCPLMCELPSGIEYLSSVAELSLLNMSDKLISKLSRDVGDENARRIAHIPTVGISYFEDDGLHTNYL